MNIYDAVVPRPRPSSASIDRQLLDRVRRDCNAMQAVRGKIITYVRPCMRSGSTALLLY